jgi:hypothetical protein
MRQPVSPAPFDIASTILRRDDGYIVSGLTDSVDRAYSVCAVRVCGFNAATFILGRYNLSGRLVGAHMVDGLPNTITLRSDYDAHPLGLHTIQAALLDQIAIKVLGVYSTLRPNTLPNIAVFALH